MIKLENYEVMGWEHVIRGMRNPMNSWDKTDSKTITQVLKNVEKAPGVSFMVYEPCQPYVSLGENDHNLMMKLRNAGTDHRKFMRMITVYVDITAPLYWWKEFDTYKVGTVANSCSTMHKIHEKEFTLEDFSCEKLRARAMTPLFQVIDELNYWRDIYNNGGMDDNYDGTARVFEPKDKEAWHQMIQLLPTSYNQKRTVMLNYEVLANIYKSRKNHKLDEWHTLCGWIEGLPYSELIVGPSLTDIPIAKEIMNEAEKRVNKVEKKRGYWVSSYNDFMGTTVVKCSQCGYSRAFEGLLNGSVILPDTCPKCGVGMEGMDDGRT